MPGPQGDVVWQRTDPHTWLLYNTDRGGAATQPAPSPANTVPQAEPQRLADFVGDEGSAAAEDFAKNLDAEKAMFIVQSRDPRLRRESRALLRDFHHVAKGIGDYGNLDEGQRESALVDHIQHMLNIGVLNIDENGDLRSSVPQTEEDRQRTLDLVNQYRDRVVTPQEAREQVMQLMGKTPSLDELQWAESQRAQGENDGSTNP